MECVHREVGSKRLFLKNIYINFYLCF